MPRFVGSPRDSDCPWIAAWDPADEAFVAFAVAVVADAVAARLFQPVDCLSLLVRYLVYSLVARSFDNFCVFLWTRSATAFFTINSTSYSLLFSYHVVALILFTHNKETTQ